MHPVLRVLSDGRTRTRRDLIAEVLDEEKISDAQRAVLLASGQSSAENRIGWAMSGLTRAAAVTKPERGRFTITDVGKQLLAANPGGVTKSTLRAIPAYNDYEPQRQTASASTATSLRMIEDPELDPTEQIETGIELLRSDVAADLLKRLQDRHPDFFEEAVVKLLLAMGYGGAENRGRRIGGTGDGGVDGVIDQDALGLDQIYIQAKRYAPESTVGREAIQSFVGALAGRGATRGVFITTSRFSTQALDYAQAIPTRIILIDGKQLTSLMIRHSVGVQVAKVYTVVEVDEDFFE
ncbi:restriction endonuclease [Arthrobacter echini]|uniref:Restriction endonuclease n=1 Tax=Arthrobacter echini TaxID=1529066 RepID=A0A5D0XN19_9MICC|nr:restriction endonuclease [Arthrobacter echini]TYC97974.1 restriction endonuclease [Arthrobacter echini]